MGTLDGKKLRDALSKAKRIGIVEESFVIEDCELVLRNLRPDEYTAVFQDCRGLDEVAYLTTYQTGHISRAIVGLNGVDFHDVEFVEDEEPDPKRPDKTRTIKVELHTYLLKNVLATWSKEAIYTAYRKFSDVVERAERQAKEGITFLLPEETEEEKYRRLLLEAKEVEEQLPDTLVDRILEEHNLMRKSTAEEIKAAMAKTDQLARDQAAATEPTPPEPEPPSPAAPAEPAPVPPVTTRVVVPSDPHQTFQQAVQARQQPAVPVAQPQTPVVQAVSQAETATISRSAKIAALESSVNDLPETLPGSHGPIAVHRPDHPIEAVEITHKQQPFDEGAAKTILNKPPAGGLNPRFRPPQRV